MRNDFKSRSDFLKYMLIYSLVGHLKLRAVQVKGLMYLRVPKYEFDKYFQKKLSHLAEFRIYSNEGARVFSSEFICQIPLGDFQIFMEDFENFKTKRLS